MIDLSIWGAFLAGMVSFITPCVLPIVPFYLAYLAGSSVDVLRSDEGAGKEARKRAIVNASGFVLGLITIFTLMGLSSSFLGQFLREYMNIFRMIAGAVMLGLGLNFLGLIRLSFLSQDRRVDGPSKVQGPFSAYLVGMAFAFGWTACVGPILATILLMAAQQESTWQGTSLLLAYGVGMGLPFFLAAVFYGYFMEFYGGFKKYLPIVEKVVGVALIVFGLLLMTNTIGYIAQWLIDLFPGFTELL